MPDTSSDIRQLLKQHWGFTSFRPFQQEVIESVLQGKDTLAIMPTGGGKSLCYQVPALAKEGLCLVISPLIALMKDQVQNLRRKNITAYSIYSGMTRREVIHTLQTVIHSNCKFLYVSPERLETGLFKEYLPGMNVNLVAVDEAHCISQWGYDFRPPYLRIASLREELPGVPILALTASATPAVQEDICTHLQFEEQHIIRQSFARPNLSYSVFRVDSRINKIAEILAKVPGTAIIYCKSRKRTREISELLRLQGIPADHYHAGLTSGERNQKQEEWLGNKTRVIVCTNAFGMGIDKPDVRCVIHVDPPDCLENYYQEAGRAGRDGKIAYSVLLYDEKELTELAELPAIRYPSQEDIRSIYQSVANYLQIPAGAAEGNSYDFDISDFMRKFKLSSPAVIYALKALEQEGWLAFNEQVFLPSSAQFTTDKHRLQLFETDHRELEPLIKALLRSYEGIFDHPAFISEPMLASLLKKDPVEIKNQLAVLHRQSIIDYAPRKESPQLLLLRERIRADELFINLPDYNKRKENFRARTKEMLHFIKEKAECRSRIIGAYFGDTNLKACGVCDNCLRQKTTQLSQEEFNSINHRILNTIKYEPLHTRELLVKLNGVKKEKAWKVIEFLQAENKICVDARGWVRLK